jgi:AcrR family transcriptional regulator
VARTYASPLREEQLAGTRLRIVEAVARVLARGVTELSVPAVAAEAGVSVATVYRHFKNKPQLVEGLARHYADQVGTSAMLRGALSLEQLEEGVRGIFTRTERLDPTLRSALASELADQFRREHRADRVRLTEAILEPHTGHMTPADRRRLRDLGVVLMSSSSQRAFNVLLGASADRAAEVVAWAIRRLAKAPATKAD